MLVRCIGRVNINCSFSEVLETEEQHTNKKRNNVPSQAWPFLYTRESSGIKMARRLLNAGGQNEKVELVTWVLKYYVDKSGERETPSLVHHVIGHRWCSANDIMLVT
jgi:hypothetical protein